jgi:hypothetical protein
LPTQPRIKSDKRTAIRTMRYFDSFINYSSFLNVMVLSKKPICNYKKKRWKTQLLFLLDL